MGSDGFRLSFSEARGILEMTNVTLEYGVLLESLEMLIPKLVFPFDVSNGVVGLRNRRHILGRLTLNVPVDGVEAYVTRQIETSEVLGYRACSFESDHVGFLVEYGPSHNRVPLSFRLIPFLVQSGIGFLIDLPRAYGPLPLTPIEAAADAIEIMFGMRPLGLEVILPSPLKWVLMSLLPGKGWRLPDYRQAKLTEFRLLADGVDLAFSHPDLLESTSVSPFRSEASEIVRLKRQEENHITRHGDRALVDHQRDEARSRYAKLLNRDLSDPFVSSRLAMIDILNPDRRETARTVATRRFDEHPDSGDLLAVLTQGAALAGEVDVEIDLLEQLHPMSPPLEQFAGAMRMGELLWERDPARAATMFDKAVETRREDPQALFSLLKIRATLGEKDRVNALVPRLLALYSDAQRRTNIHLEIGEIFLFELKNPSDAVAHFERVLLVDPDNTQAAWGLAESLAEMDEVAQAVSHFERLIQREKDQGNNKNAAKALFRLGRLWREREENALAVHRFHESLELEPDNSERRICLAEVLTEMSLYADAAQAYEVALKKGPDAMDANAFGVVAMVLSKLYLEKLEDIRAAKVWAKKALLMTSVEVEAKALIYECLRRQGFYGVATPRFSSSREVVELADEFIAIGDEAEGKKTLEMGGTAFPDGMDIQDRLIDLYRDDDDHEQLLKHLTQRVETVVSPKRRAQMEVEIGHLTLSMQDNPSSAVVWFTQALEKAELKSARDGLQLAADALNQKARELLDAGEYEAARMMFEALEIQGGGDQYRQAHLADAEEALKQDDFERAYHSAMAGATGPAIVRTRALLLAARALTRQGLKEQAVQILEEMSRSLDREGEVRLLQAAIDISVKQLKDKERIRFVFERFFKDHPEREDVDQALIKLLTLAFEGNDLARYLSEGPGEFLSVRLRRAAEIYLEGGRRNLAVQTMTRCYRQDQSVDNLAFLVSVLKATGKLEAAIELLEERRGEDPRIDQLLHEELKSFSAKMEARTRESEATIPPSPTVAPPATTRGSIVPPDMSNELLEDENALDDRLSQAFTNLRKKS